MPTPEESLLAAVFPNVEDNPLPEFNDLVRDAFEAQEAFDNWDRGTTWTGPIVGKRVCTLDQVTKEWDDANRKLIEFVNTYGTKMLLLLSEKK